MMALLFAGTVTGEYSNNLSFFKSATCRRPDMSKSDKIRARLSEHSSNVQLYGAAEERYASLKENTRKLVDEIKRTGTAGGFV